MHYDGGSQTVVRGFGVMVRVAMTVEVTVADPTEATNDIGRCKCQRRARRMLVSTKVSLVRLSLSSMTLGGRAKKKAVNE